METFNLPVFSFYGFFSYILTMKSFLMIHLNGFAIDPLPPVVLTFKNFNWLLRSRDFFVKNTREKWRSSFDMILWLFEFFLLSVFTLSFKDQWASHVYVLASILYCMINKIYVFILVANSFNYNFTISLTVKQNEGTLHFNFYFEEWWVLYLFVNFKLCLYISITGIWFCMDLMICWVVWHPRTLSS